MMILRTSASERIWDLWKGIWDSRKEFRISGRNFGNLGRDFWSLGIIKRNFETLEEMLGFTGRDYGILLVNFRTFGTLTHASSTCVKCTV